MKIHSQRGLLHTRISIVIHLLVSFSFVAITCGAWLPPTRQHPCVCTHTQRARAAGYVYAHTHCLQTHPVVVSLFSQVKIK
jgi:hypothetical protein